MFGIDIRSTWHESENDYCWEGGLGFDLWEPSKILNCIRFRMYFEMRLAVANRFFEFSLSLPSFAND